MFDDPDFDCVRYFGIDERSYARRKRDAKKMWNGIFWIIVVVCLICVFCIL